jgi:hypothetical protein
MKTYSPPISNAAPRAGTLTRALTSGSAASLLSAAVLALRGRREAGSAAAPVNAVAHWIYGDKAYAVDRADLKHTVVGMAIHHASAVLWGLLYEAVLRRIAGSSNRGPSSAARPGSRLTPGEILGGAVAVSAVAALTDLRLVPTRLSPGFEHRLRPASVFLVYVAFAGGLALAVAASRRR